MHFIFIWGIHYLKKSFIFWSKLLLSLLKWVRFNDMKANGFNSKQKKVFNSSTYLDNAGHDVMSCFIKDWDSLTYETLSIQRHKLWKPIDLIPFTNILHLFIFNNCCIICPRNAMNNIHRLKYVIRASFPSMQVEYHHVISFGTMFRWFLLLH